MEKRCGTCRKVKDVSLFSKNSCGKDGLNWRCRECSSIALKIYREKVKYKHVFEKFNFKCAHCGSAKSLHIHHVNGKISGDDKNLLLVCQECHCKHFHRGYTLYKSRLCKRCNHAWVPRLCEARVCPKCHSPWWNKKRNHK